MISVIPMESNTSDYTLKTCNAGLFVLWLGILDLGVTGAILLDQKEDSKSEYIQ